jgi:HlyD family secretion protein
MKYLWILALAAAGVATALWTMTSLQPDSPRQEQAPATERARTSKLVAAPGRVEPASEEIRIGSELNGKLQQVLVQEGDRVRHGQVLAVLSNADFAARVSFAEAALQQRLAELERLQNGSRVEERAESQAELEEAQAVLENAKANVGRRRQLFRSGDISRATLDASEREVAVADARVRAARQRRELVERSTRVEDLASARAAVEQARAELAEARALLAKTRIVSPISGVVLRRHLKSGESVSDQADNVVLELGDDSTLHVRVEVDEADIAKVRLGQPVYVTAEAYGSRKFTGKVVRIGQMLGRKKVRTDEPSERVDTKVLETLVALDPGQHLPTGLRVDAYIQVDN